MTYAEAADEIRATISMDVILAAYGYKPEHDYIKCPFHAGDRTASLRIYKGKKGWHCFGCGRGGSVIDFVMEHEGYDFVTAVKAIDKVHGLHLLEGGAGDPLRMMDRQKLTMALERMADELNDYADRMERFDCAEIKWLMAESGKIMDIPRSERTAEQWWKLTELEDRMKRLEDQITCRQAARREVGEWLRKSRRALMPG